MCQQFYLSHGIIDDGYLTVCSPTSNHHGLFAPNSQMILLDTTCLNSGQTLTKLSTHQRLWGSLSSSYIPPTAPVSNQHYCITAAVRVINRSEDKSCFFRCLFFQKVFLLDSQSSYICILWDVQQTFGNLSQSQIFDCQIFYDMIWYIYVYVYTHTYTHIYMLYHKKNLAVKNLRLRQIPKSLLYPCSIRYTSQQVSRSQNMKHTEE